MTTTTNVENDKSGVSLRIEGDQSTIFDDRVTINCGGTHQCDRTNGNCGSISDPTVTDVLETASKPDKFIWECKYYKDLQGCFITRINGIPQDTPQHKNKDWRIYINYQPIEVGACQNKVQKGDNVLFAFDGFNKTQVLKLETSDETIAMGGSIIVTVTDGNTGKRISDAIVRNQRTDAEGHATLTFNELGESMIKAEHPDSIRSNTVCVKVTE